MLKKLIQSAGLAPYSFDGSYYGALHAAVAKQTEGRTHYFDPGTCRSFGSRIHKARSESGAVLIVLESVKHPSEGKLYRVVAFDVDGWVIWRTGDPDGERAGIALQGFTGGATGYRTKARAEKEYYALADYLTEEQCARITRAALARILKTHLCAAQSITEALGA